MGKKAAKKGPKLVLTASGGAAVSQKKAKKTAKDAKRPRRRKSSAYVVDDDAIKLMRRQLADVGCKLQEVEADGNCLFRALGDQLFGDQHQHEDVRKRIVAYLEQHRDDFEPFMEDEEKFERYCERMLEDGTWGGNQELYAAARLFQVYVVVHQDQPSARVMVIECDRLKPQRVVHVAYHGEDHYDSVRSLRDPVDPDCLPAAIALDCDGFRAEDLAKRWQTHGSTSESAGGDLQQPPRIVPEPQVAGGNAQEIDALATRLHEQLQVSAAAGAVASARSDGKPLSKKAQRQLRKAARSSAGRAPSEEQG